MTLPPPPHSCRIAPCDQVIHQNPGGADIAARKGLSAALVITLGVAAFHILSVSVFFRHLSSKFSKQKNRNVMTIRQFVTDIKQVFYVQIYNRAGH